MKKREFLMPKPDSLGKTVRLLEGVFLVEILGPRYEDRYKITAISRFLQQFFTADFDRTAFLQQFFLTANLL